MVNVGLVTGPATPSARSAPRTNVVFPAPRSPETSTTSPGRSDAARDAARASVSAGEAVSVAAIGGATAQRQPEGDERHAGQRDGDDVEAGARQLRRAGRVGGRGLGRGLLDRRLGGGRRLRGGRGLLGRGRLLGLGLGLGLRLRLRLLGLLLLGRRLAGERILVL